MKQPLPIEKLSKKQTTVLVLLLIAPYLLGLTGIFAHGTWRYEMTVLVETPEGIKTGSAVRQVSNTAMFEILNFPGGGNPADFKGEAIVVELGERGFLFAVLKANPEYEFYGMFSNPYGKSTPQGINYYNWHVDREKKIYDPLKYPSYPTFVTFEDINDPKSVQLAYKTEMVGGHGSGKYQIINNMVELFGEGVRIKEVSIQRVRKNIKWKIQKILPWLPDYYDKRLDGAMFGTINSKHRLANRLSAGSFSTRRNKK